MRYTLADTTYGCHVSEFPPGPAALFTATVPAP
jgi:hypothetical protein